MDAAVVLEPNACCVRARDIRHAAGFEGRRARAGVLDVGADADPDQAALAARFLLLLASAGVVECLQRRLEGGGVVAGLVRMVRHAEVGHPRRRHEVDPPHVRGIQPEPRGDQVHEPLVDQNRGHHADAAIRAFGALVGRDGV